MAKQRHQFDSIMEMEKYVVEKLDKMVDIPIQWNILCHIMIITNQKPIYQLPGFILKKTYQ